MAGWRWFWPVWVGAHYCLLRVSLLWVWWWGSWCAWWLPLPSPPLCVETRWRSWDCWFPWIRAMTSDWDWGKSRGCSHHSQHWNIRSTCPNHLLSSSTKTITAIQIHVLQEFLKKWLEHLIDHYTLASRYCKTALILMSFFFIKEFITSTL